MNHTYKEIAEFCQSIYQGKRLLIVPYAYQVTFLTLSSEGIPQTGNLNITANADFVLTEISSASYTSTDDYNAASGGPYAPVTLLITDSGTNEQFTDIPIDLGNCSSNGLTERPLTFPRWIQGRTNLQVVASVYNPAVPGFIQRLDVVFSGVLVRAYAG